MSKNLVIVESPAKAKTIEKFLGPDYVVKSSIGHIRDMPKKDMGIDLNNNFLPTYAVSGDKRKIVSDLKKSVKAAEKVYLATDEDREGEAIAWHLQQALSLADDTPRIVFHEITKSAISNAISNPRTITAHSPVKSYKVKATLADETNELFEAKLNEDFATKEDAQNFVNDMLQNNMQVVAVETKPSKRSPKAPFITSTLQQEASQKLGFSVKQTMSIAQNLYRDGAITYMRTDSLNLSEEAITAAKEVIVSSHGIEFHEARRYKTKSSSAQEAHEAIRPTDLTKTSILGLDDQSAKLYSLIYKRTLASQMSDAQLQKTKISIDITNRNEHFVADGEVLSFSGFLKVYDYMTAEDKLLPRLDIGSSLSLVGLIARESFSRAKPRYTEASLVKEIEQMGIGRPSTFATMITTVQDRNYVVKETREGIQRDYHQIEIVDGVISESIQSETTGAEKNKLFPTSVAYILVDFLLKNFRNIIGYEFTANLESDFDQIAEKSKPWTGVVRDFYDPFHEQIELAKDISRDETHGKRELGEDPTTGKTVSVRFGRYGPFAQIGHQDDEEKPTFASLRKGQDIETITLVEALELFKMPRILGETYDGETVKANYGRFGPYIQYGKKYVSLKDISPEEVTFETALELIAAKEKFDAERIIKVFDDSDIQILNGRFGPYIWNGKKRGKGQKNVTVEKVFGNKAPIDLTLEECIKAIDGKVKSKSKKRKKRVGSKKETSSNQ